eukprot:5743865-Pyramimonas_sp.AAC.2
MGPRVLVLPSDWSDGSSSKPATGLSASPEPPIGCQALREEIEADIERFQESTGKEEQQVRPLLFLSALPSFDWSPSREYILSPRVIGHQARNIRFNRKIVSTYEPKECSLTSPGHTTCTSRIPYGDRIVPSLIVTVRAATGGVTIGSMIRGQWRVGRGSIPVSGSNGV